MHVHVYESMVTKELHTCQAKEGSCDCICASEVMNFVGLRDDLSNAVVYCSNTKRSTHTEALVSTPEAYHVAIFHSI